MYYFHSSPFFANLTSKFPTFIVSLSLIFPSLDVLALAIVKRKLFNIYEKRFFIFGFRLPQNILEKI